MIKKTLLVLALAVFAITGAFSQTLVDFFAETDMGYAANPLSINPPMILPSLGMSFHIDNLKNVEIMAGISLGISSAVMEISSTTIKKNLWYTGIYAGIAPKAGIFEKWTLSMPILAQLQFGGMPENKIKNFGFGLKTGVKASYTISNKWNLFAGFLFNVFSYQKETESSGDSTAYTNFFNKATVLLGVSRRLD